MLQDSDKRETRISATDSTTQRSRRKAVCAKEEPSGSVYLDQRMRESGGLHDSSKEGMGDLKGRWSVKIP